MVLTLERLGIPWGLRHHHEVASGGQCEIDLRYQTLTRMADQVMTYKYVVKNVARAAGKAVTFMPKPLFGDNGSAIAMYLAQFSYCSSTLRPRHVANCAGRHRLNEGREDPLRRLTTACA